MATTRKPAARTTAKRTTARKTTTPRKKVALTPPAEELKTPKVEVSEAQRQAMFEAYVAMQQAGLEIPDNLQIVSVWLNEVQQAQETEQRQVAEQAAAEQVKIDEANKNGPWYVRNGYPAPFNLRLDRQTEKRRIELKPRGTPGDLHPLKDEDLRDPVLKQNLNLGLIEVIPAGEANRIIEKQTTNMGQRIHTPLNILRNELDQAYKQGDIKVAAEFNSQGVTVAQVDPRVNTGQMHDRELRNTGGLQRGQQRLPGEALPPGSQPEQATSIVRSGFVPTGGQPAYIQHPGIQADIARRAEGVKESTLHRGPGELQVVVDPVQKA